tara:strand:+ start:676 stop:792 length:117 start_codon:yes stop_codon:yes gene_type:complete
MEYIEINGEYFVIDNNETDPNGEPLFVQITKEEYDENT